MPFLVAMNSTFARAQRRSASTGAGVGTERLGQIGQVIHFAAIHRLEQRLAGREVPVQRADADAGPLRHRLQAGIRAAGAEHRLRRLEHTLAVAQRVRARPSRHLCRGLRHHTPLTSA